MIIPSMFRKQTILTGVSSEIHAMYLLVSDQYIYIFTVRFYSILENKREIRDLITGYSSRFTEHSILTILVKLHCTIIYNKYATNVIIWHLLIMNLYQGRKSEFPSRQNTQWYLFLKKRMYIYLILNWLFKVREYREIFLHSIKDWMSVDQPRARLYPLSP